MAIDIMTNMPLSGERHFTCLGHAEMSGTSTRSASTWSTSGVSPKWMRPGGTDNLFRFQSGCTGSLLAIWSTIPGMVEVKVNDTGVHAPGPPVLRSADLEIIVMAPMTSEQSRLTLAQQRKGQ